MRRVLGLLTEDFRLYHDLVAALKRRGLPFRSLSFGGRIPGTVGAILTSPAEAPRIRFPNIIAVEDVEAGIARGRRALEDRRPATSEDIREMKAELRRIDRRLTAIEERLPAKRSSGAKRSSASGAKRSGSGRSRSS